MSSLSELIALVENAGAGDRFIDGEIALAVGWEGMNCHGLKWSDTFPSCREKWQDDREPFDNWKVPRYTESIDAALTLLPGKHGYYIRENCSSDGDEIYCNAQVWPYSDHRDDDAPRYWANSKQGAPALALVAACLKVRLLDAASSEAADQ